MAPLSVRPSLMSMLPTENVNHMSTGDTTARASRCHTCTATPWAAHIEPSEYDPCAAPTAMVLAAAAASDLKEPAELYG